MRLILTLFAVIVTGVIVYCLVPPDEPVYHGKKLSEWLRIAAKPVPSSIFRQNPRVQNDMLRDWRDAHSAIRAVGTNGYLTIRRLLRSRDGTIKRGFKELVNGRNILGLHLATDVERVNMAALAINTLGSDAIPLLPDLIKVGQDPNPKLRGPAISTVFFLMKLDITCIEPYKLAVLGLMASAISDPGLRGQTIGAVSLLPDSDKDRVRAIWLEQHPDHDPATQRAILLPNDPPPRHPPRSFRAPARRHRLLPPAARRTRFQRQETVWMDVHHGRSLYALLRR